MKSRVLLAVTILAGFAASAQAATIAGTKHDLSVATAGSVSISGTNQTCVFCHTPHNAIVNKLLWNRANALSGATFGIFTSYNSTAMRTALISRTTLADSSTSLLCLSCHSLATTAGLVTNSRPSSGVTLADTSNAAAQARWGAQTGNMLNLTNDHPVGINYVTAAAADTTGLVGATGTTSVGVPTVRLFSNSVTGAGTMECATCHSVHDATNGKFLAISNSSSALCRTCHVK